MQKRESIIFSLLFIVTLTAVPVVQLLGECMRGERIQAFDLFEDTFFTPGKRTRKLTGRFEQLFATIDDFIEKLRLGEKGGDYYSFAEEILYSVKALRENAAEVNRHIKQEQSKSLSEVDSLVMMCEKLLDQIDDDEKEQVVKRLELIQKDAEVCRLHVLPEVRMVSVRRIFSAFFKATFFNNRYLRAYEKELEDRSVFVLSIRPVMQMVRYWLLGDVGAKAIAGKNGWLFYRPGVEYLYRPSVYDPRSKSVDYNDKALTDDPVGTILDFRTQLNDRGVELLMVVVPGKGSIYPDMLGGKSCVNEKETTHSAEFMALLQSEGVNVVDLFTPFLAERTRDTLYGDSLYLARDTHWRPRALRIAAAAVAEAVKRYQWYDESHYQSSYRIDTVEVERTGDVGVMTNLPNVRLRQMHASFPTELTTCFQVMHNYLNDSGEVVRRMPYKDDFRKSRILILGDSFSRIYQTDAPRSAGWIAHLAYELSEPLASLVSDGGASTLVREKLARKAGVLNAKKLVIWEFVERDIRFGAFGWKKVTLP